MLANTRTAWWWHLLPKHVADEFYTNQNRVLNENLNKNTCRFVNLSLVYLTTLSQRVASVQFRINSERTTFFTVGRTTFTEARSNERSLVTQETHKIRTQSYTHASVATSYSVLSGRLHWNWTQFARQRFARYPSFFRNFSSWSVYNVRFPYTNLYPWG
jgi:hypothetical protein